MSSNEELIQALIKDGYLKTPLIIEAFRVIDRKDFLPDELKEEAYLNVALSIGSGQTISQPLVVAFMLELLNIKAGDKILEIGAGSGWQTALIAQIVSRLNPETKFEKAPVISIERIEELYKFAKKNIAKYGFLKKGIVELILGDGSKGYESEAPYDKIISAASAQTLPQEWKEQLKIGGKIIAPVKESIIVIEKVSKDEMDTKEFFGFSFVPLVKGK